jgi:hypothetical protein
MLEPTQGAVHVTDAHAQGPENDENIILGHSLDDGSADSLASKASAPNRPRTLLKIGLEVILISAGVFLGLMGDQWRERAQHRELAQESLRRFRAEILANRSAVEKVKDYHVITKAKLERYFAADPKTRNTVDVEVHGLQPVFFARTAWDLALATQSLTYIDPQLAFALSRIYTLQQDYAGLTSAVMQAIYFRMPTENLEQFFGTVNVYYGDIVLWEPALLKLYDEVIPQIDRALGDSAR